MTDALRLSERSRLAREYMFYWRKCKNWRTVVSSRRTGVPFNRFELRCGAIIGFSGNPPWNIFSDIWRHHEYTRAPLRFYSTPRVVVDIGANVGFFTLYAATQWRDASIYAYEPAPENFATLTHNVELSRASRVCCSSRAVAAARGETKLYLKQESGWHSIWAEGAESSITVPTISLDDIAREIDGEAIDFLKLDCEGAEYAILTGCEALLSTLVRQIAMEYHEVGGHTVVELASLFERAGFAYVTKPAPSHFQTGMLYAINRGSYLN
jgi:FkbM family methyltransferase